MKNYIDISVPINSDLPVWPGSQNIEIKQSLSIKNSDIANESSINMNVHTGTHVDAPSHFINNGLSIDQIPITKFIGPAYVASIKNTETITKDILNNSSIPKDTKRLLIQTDNTELWVSRNTKFYEDYIALSLCAANWIVDKGIELVGIDYLSIQKYNDSPQTHIELLSNNIVILEGLNLSNVTEGWYDLICLPLKLEKIEASPARALLIDNSSK